MATSYSTNTYNRVSWEESDFPILCQTCLGDNPYIRMTKERHGKECKICSRPFTVFRWCPGARMRFKKTEVCQTCSRLKNVCQTCLLDLEYGLPIQVRDTAAGSKDDPPRSDVNKEYFVQNMDAKLKSADPNETIPNSGKSQSSSDLLLKLARTTPYYKRNRPHICSFWVKGNCRRGEECPYRHEKPTDPDDPLADQNIKDRYYGVNDPVAEKLLRRAAAMPKLEPPEDLTITTLYVGNLGDVLAEKDLRDHFYQYGEIRSVAMVPRQQCGFVTFTTRAAAELASERTFNKLILKGRRLTIKWGKTQAKQGTSEKDDDEPKLEPVPGLPGTLPKPPEDVSTNYFNLADIPHPPLIPPPRPPQPPPGVLPPVPPPFMVPPQLRPTPLRPPPGVRPPNMIPPPLAMARALRPTAIHYPSQDPQRMGARNQ